MTAPLRSRVRAGAHEVPSRLRDEFRGELVDVQHKLQPSASGCMDALANHSSPADEKARWTTAGQFQDSSSHRDYDPDPSRQTSQARGQQPNGVEEESKSTIPVGPTRGSKRRGKQQIKPTVQAIESGTQTIRKSIYRGRSGQRAEYSTRSTPSGNARRQNAVGLALSGGGIRSATFCLGAWQLLAVANCSRRGLPVDRVSGGGYPGCFSRRRTEEREIRSRRCRCIRSGSHVPVR